MIHFLWMAYLAVMLFLTYDLIIASISRVARKLLDTDLLHLAIVSIMWAVWIMYYKP